MDTYETHGDKYMRRKFYSTIAEDMSYSRYHMCDTCFSHYRYRVAEPYIMLELMTVPEPELYSPIIDNRSSMVKCPRCGGHLFPVDDNMVYPVATLNLKGYKTMFSCEGHIPDELRYDPDYRTLQVYLSFKSWAIVPSEIPDSWFKGIDKIYHWIEQYNHLKWEEKFGDTSKKLASIASQILYFSWIESKTMEAKESVTKFKALDDLYKMVHGLPDISDDLDEQIIPSTLEDQLEPVEKILACICMSFIYTKVKVDLKVTSLDDQKQKVGGIAMLVGTCDGKDVVVEFSIYATKNNIWFRFEPATKELTDQEEYSDNIAKFLENIEPFKFKFGCEDIADLYVPDHPESMCIGELMNHKHEMLYDTRFYEWFMNCALQLKIAFKGMNFIKIAQFGLVSTTQFID